MYSKMKRSHMDASPTTLNQSDKERLARLAKHGKSVYPTRMGIELDNGEFWGRRADMRTLENLGFVQYEKVMHGTTEVRHYRVSSTGLDWLEANVE
jgi:hypothetical protein